MSAPNVVRPRDISGLPLPARSAPLAQAQGAPPVVVSRPAEIEPGPGAQEFILSWSVVVNGGATAQLFTVDAQGNVTNGAAFQLPDNTRARISGVIIEGETILGTPVLQFSIRTTQDGQRRLAGWQGVNLPGRGGIVSMAIEPFTVVPVNSFFGAFVTNSDAGPHYASMTIQGWYF